MNEHQNNPHQPNPADGPLAPQPQPQSSGPGSRASDPIDEIASTLRDLFNRVPERVGRAFERAINVRDTTVLVRLSDESSDKLDTLVSAGVFRSRAEAAAFLIGEGINAQTALFQRIQNKLGEIEKLREELRTSISPETL